MHIFIVLTLLPPLSNPHHPIVVFAWFWLNRWSVFTLLWLWNTICSYKTAKHTKLWLTFPAQLLFSLELMIVFYFYVFGFPWIYCKFNPKLLTHCLYFLKIRYIHKINSSSSWGNLSWNPLNCSNLDSTQMSFWNIFSSSCWYPFLHPYIGSTLSYIPSAYPSLVKFFVWEHCPGTSWEKMSGRKHFENLHLEISLPSHLIDRLAEEKNRPGRK